MSVVMNFAMFPTDKGISVSPFVSKVIEVIRKQGFESQLTAMGTIVETDNLSEALNIIHDAYSALESDCDRVYVSLNLDIKKGTKGRIISKVESIEDKLKKLK